jgi:hypothetical protein
MKNAFASAKVAPVAPKAKKSKAEEVVIVGLRDLAALDAAMKAMKSLKETIEADVKEAEKAYFVQKGVETGVRPLNFTGVEDFASSSVQLRVRGENSPLSDEEVALCEEYEIPLNTVTMVEETFIINPAYLDSGILAKVGEAIAKVKGVPEDFILKQESVSKKVANDESIKALFATKDENKISSLFSIVGTLANRLTVGDKIAEAMEVVRKMVTGDADKKKEEEAA